MNFEDAIRSHTNWKLKLKEYISKKDGSLNHEEVSKDNCCDLGKWIYSDAINTITDKKFYEDLRLQHQLFHKEAGEIIRRVNLGEDVNEELAIGSSSQYNVISSKVLLILIKLNKN